MSFEDDLRRGLEDRVSSVHPTPDAEDLLERAGRAAHRRNQTFALLAMAAALLVGAAGVAGGAALSTPKPAPAAAPAAGSPGRGFSGPDAAVAPGASPIGGPSTTLPVAQPLTHLFSRTTSGGVTIRAYTSPPTGTTTGCPPTATCVQPPGAPTTTTTAPTGVTTPTACTSAQPCIPGSPPCNGATVCPVPVTCPPNALCAQPQSVPAQGVPAQTGAPASGSATTGSATTGSATTGSVPSPVPASCPEETVTLEFSTDAAVATATTGVPTDPGTPAGTVALAGTGSFGAAEGSASAWALVSAGPGVATVRVTVAGATDQMAPVNGLAVVALPGLSDLVGGEIDGLDATGNVASSVTVPAAGSPVAPIACAPTTTTVPPAPATTVPSTTSPVPPTTLVVPPTVPTPVTVPPGGGGAGLPPRGAGTPGVPAP